MAKKKRYTGIVIADFGYKNKQYKVDDKFTSTEKQIIEYLIKTNRLKWQH